MACNRFQKGINSQISTPLILIQQLADPLEYNTADLFSRLGGIYHQKPLRLPPSAAQVSFPHLAVKGQTLFFEAGLGIGA